MNIKEYTQKVLTNYSATVKEKTLEKEIYASKENEGYVKKSEKAKTLECMSGMSPMHYVGTNSEGVEGVHPFPVGSNETSNNLQVVKLGVRAGETLSVDLISEDKTTNSLVQCYEYIAGESDVVQTLKTFNNASKDNFYYNSKNIEFSDGVQIANEFSYPFTLNGKGVYETGIIPINSFLEIGEPITTLSTGIFALPPIEGLGGRASISFESTTYHNGSNADTVESLLDGDLENHTAYGVLVTSNERSHFKFTVSSKVRIHAYGTHYRDSAGVTGQKVKLFKDGVLVGVYPTKVGEWYVLFDELEAGTYQLKVTDYSENYVNFTEWYVEDLSVPSYLIKENGKYYSPLAANYSEEFGFKEVTLSTLNRKEDCAFVEQLFTNIEVEGEIFKPISKFENPTIVSLEEVPPLTFKGIKSRSELIIASNSFSTKSAENIDFFNLENETSENAEIYLAVSNDYGDTWLTTQNCGETWISLDNRVELKKYEKLNEEELVQWDNLKEEIIQKGIVADNLKNVNFNTLESSQLRFAYCFKINNHMEVAKCKQLKWQFDSFGTMKRMNDADIDVELTSQSILFTPYRDTDILKINISNSFTS